MKLIACESGLELGTQISKLLNVPLASYQTRHFANTETNPDLLESVRGHDVFIIGTGYTIGKYPIDTAVMEMYLLACTCRDSDAKSITLVVPHFPYARQDKKSRPHEPISARYVCDMFQLASVSRIIAVELHSSSVQGFFRGPFDNLYGSIVVKPFIEDLLFKDNAGYKQQYVAVAPDAGGYNRTSKYAEKLGLEFISIQKKRNPEVINKVTSVIHGTVDINGKTCIIFDDICDTGGTIIAAVEQLCLHGAKDVIVVVTHGLFSNQCFDLLNANSCISQFICSDSVPQSERLAKSSKMKVFSIAPLLAEVIGRTLEGRSNSDLFV